MSNVPESEDYGEAHEILKAGKHSYVCAQKLDITPHALLCERIAICCRMRRGHSGQQSIVAGKDRPGVRLAVLAASAVALGADFGALPNHVKQYIRDLETNAIEWRENAQALALKVRELDQATIACLDKLRMVVAWLETGVSTAKGDGGAPCCCAEIDPSDKPCIVCDSRESLVLADIKAAIARIESKVMT